MKMVIVQLDTGETGVLISEHTHYSVIRLREGVIGHDVIVPHDDYTVLDEYIIGYEIYEVSELPEAEG